MDFSSLAVQLLQSRARLLLVPAQRDVSRMLRGELFVLNYLREQQRTVHPKELSDRLCVSSARIARLLNVLEKDDMIDRHTDPADSRSVVVALTPKGEAEIDQVRGAVLDHISSMLQALGEEDSKTYIRILDQIYRNYQEQKN